MNIDEPFNRKDPARNNRIESERKGTKQIHEPPRETPVVGEFDVIVAGGGPAGVGAALAAADQGASVLIVERHGMLGGVWTAGLLNPFFDQIAKGYMVQELIDRLNAGNAWRHWRRNVYCFDVESMKYLLERWCQQLGITVWYHAPIVDAIVEDRLFKGVILEGKSGREAVLAQVCIDATGDGDLAARGGASYAYGRMEDGAAQPMTLMFEIDQMPPGFVHAESKQHLRQEMEAALERNGVEYQWPIGCGENAPYIINVPKTQTAVVQFTHVYGHSALNTQEVSAATIEARRQAYESIEAFRQLPGFENIRLTQTAPALGIREGRRIHGDAVLTEQHIYAGARWEDAVAFGSFGIDIHDPKPGSRATQDQNKKRQRPQPYEIPYGCLLPRGLEGLLVAGRCISGTHVAHSSYRVTGTCMQMGQAAGVAAAMAARQGVAPRRIEGTRLKRRLQDLGAGFLEDHKAARACITSP